MQAVILAAGRGSRLKPMTDGIPKPLLKVHGKCLIDYNIEKLPPEINEVILVVGYLEDQIKAHFGDNYLGYPIKYVRQEELLGTGHAVSLCQHLIQDKFLVLMGDDIYSAEDIQKAVKQDLCILVKKIKGPFIGGNVILDSEGNLEDIIEGEHEQEHILMNTGMYVLDKNFFNYDLVKIPGKNEYGLPQTLVKVSRDFPVKIQIASQWIQVNDIEGLKQAEKILK